MARYSPAPRGTDVLFEAVRTHLETFLSLAEQAGRPIPMRVERELRSYLGCGVPSSGFALLRCPRCPGRRLVPFTCGGRAFCPTCIGRAMNDHAAHVLDRVFPEVGVRQFVLTVPMPLRLRMAWDVDLRCAVHRIFVSEVTRDYRYRAGLPEGRCGSLTAIQNFGSALNLNVHFHTLFCDGVWVWDPGATQPRFVDVAPPSTEDIHAIVERIQARVHRLLVRRGLEQPDEDDIDDPDGLALVQQASAAGRAALGRRAGRKPRCLRGPASTRRLPNRTAQVGWFNLHANVRIAPHDRRALERLVRYISRPPLSRERLTRLHDGRYQLRFKRPWADGTSAIFLSGVELLARLAALVHPPRAQRWIYAGVFGPASSWRSAVVCAPAEPTAELDVVLEPLYSVRSPRGRDHRPRLPWAHLLWRVFHVDDAWLCPDCGARMHVHAVVQGLAVPDVLNSLGHRVPRTDALAARAPPPDWELVA